MGSGNGLPKTQWWSPGIAIEGSRPMGTGGMREGAPWRKWEAGGGTGGGEQESDESGISAFLWLDLPLRAAQGGWP